MVSFNGIGVLVFLKPLFVFSKKGVFAMQKYGFCFLNVVLLQSVSNIIGRLSAAVGADLSRPHIGIHPQNDEWKHVCGEMDTRIQ